FFVFFFQAEDGIRDFHVTGVQTCALPIFLGKRPAVCYSWRLIMITHVKEAEAFLVRCQAQEITDMVDGPRAAPVAADTGCGCHQPKVLYRAGGGRKLLPLGYGTAV